MFLLVAKAHRLTGCTTVYRLGLHCSLAGRCAGRCADGGAKMAVREVRETPGLSLQDSLPICRLRRRGTPRRRRRRRARPGAAPGSWRTRRCCWRPPRGAPPPRRAPCSMPAATRCPTRWSFSSKADTRQAVAGQVGRARNLVWPGMSFYCTSVRTTVWMTHIKRITTFLRPGQWVHTTQEEYCCVLCNHVM